MTTQYKDR